MVRADPPRLRQVLRNLLDNAEKYGEPPIVITADEDDGRVRCAVLDSGPGIPADQAQLVFQPYSRLIQDPTMSSPGLGLGLPIVQQLIMAQGGEVALVKEGDKQGLEIRLPAIHLPAAHAGSR